MDRCLACVRIPIGLATSCQFMKVYVGFLELKTRRKHCI